MSHGIVRKQSEDEQPRLEVGCGGCYANGLAGDHPSLYLITWPVMENLWTGWGGGVEHSVAT